MSKKFVLIRVTSDQIKCGLKALNCSLFQFLNDLAFQRHLLDHIPPHSHIILSFSLDFSQTQYSVLYQLLRIKAESVLMPNALRLLQFFEQKEIKIQEIVIEQDRLFQLNRFFLAPVTRLVVFLIVVALFGSFWGYLTIAEIKTDSIIPILKRDLAQLEAKNLKQAKHTRSSIKFHNQIYYKLIQSIIRLPIQLTQLQCQDKTILLRGYLQKANANPFINQVQALESDTFKMKQCQVTDVSVRGVRFQMEFISEI